MLGIKLASPRVAPPLFCSVLFSLLFCGRGNESIKHATYSLTLCSAEGFFLVPKLLVAILLPNLKKYSELILVVVFDIRGKKSVKEEQETSNFPTVSSHTSTHIPYLFP